jgi:hypothetical protein
LLEVVGFVVVLQVVTVVRGGILLLQEGRAGVVLLVSSKYGTAAVRTRQRQVDKSRRVVSRRGLSLNNIIDKLAFVDILRILGRNPHQVHKGGGSGTVFIKE